MTPERHQLIGKLYHESLDLAPDERAAFLDVACAGDIDLCREVESLLALDNQAESFLEEPPSEAAAELLAQGEAGLIEGQLIGHYRVVSLLGAGGMGKVYLANDLTLGRRVALKLLPTQFTRDADRLRRFKQEARAIAALNHPNIITIYEIGETEGTHYIATEFIDGDTLRQRMNSATMKVSDAVEIAVHVASALVAAHNSGVVHRDIKPENIMVRKDGLVKVLDFGLSKFEVQPAGFETDPRTDTGMSTNAGVVMGTVRYMSPEQVRGAKLDARSDIFSLGVVLHEMLVGTSPFPGATTADAIAAILSQEAPPVAPHLPQSPEALDSILSRCLRKEREERYQTAQEMLDALKELKPELESGGERRAVSSRAVQLPQASPLPRRRMSAIAKVVAALAVLTAASFAGWMSLANRRGAPATTPITSLAVLPLANLSHDPEQEFFSDGMTEALNTQLGNIGNLRVTSSTSVMRYKNPKKSLTDIAGELKVDALIEGSVLRFGSKVRITVRLMRAGREESRVWGQEYNADAPDVLAMQNAVARDIAREIEIQLSPREQQRLARADTVDPEAHIAYLMGRQFWNQSDVVGYSEALKYFQKAEGISPGYAAPYAGMADTYVELGYGGAMLPKDAYESARTAAMEALRRDPDLAEAEVSLAAVLNDYDWNWAEAESHYKRALTLNPSYSVGHIFYASNLSARNRVPEAIAQIQRALDLDPGSVKAKYTLGMTYYLGHDYQRAIDSYRRALDQDPSFSPLHEALAVVYELKGMPDEAFAEYRKYLETGGAPAAEIAAFEEAYRSGGVRGYLRNLLGREEEDEKQGNGVWPLRRASFYARLGDKERALQWIETALDRRDPRLQYLGVEPVYDSLQGDPRFRKFLERLRLPARN